MITTEEYKTLLKYSARFVKDGAKQDSYDIAQTACLLLLKNPPEKRGGLPKAFLYLLAKRASYQYYFANNKKFTANMLEYVADIPEIEDMAEQHALVEANDSLGKFIMQTRVKNAHNNSKHSLTEKEKSLLLKIIDGYTPELNDRTHYTNLKRKMTLWQKSN